MGETPEIYSSLYQAGKPGWSLTAYEIEEYSLCWNRFTVDFFCIVKSMMPVLKIGVVEEQIEIMALGTPQLQISRTFSRFSEFGSPNVFNFLSQNPCPLAWVIQGPLGVAF